MAQLGPWGWMALGYLVAAIPVGLIVGKLKGLDLREIGSGNIGATNAVRALGPALGALVFLLDVAKAGAPLWFAMRDESLSTQSPIEAWPQFWVAAVGLCCVLGHVYPVYLRFRGGKGVACALGILGVLHWPVAVGALVIYVQTLALVRVSSVASLGALTGAAVVVCVMPFDPAYRSLVLIMCAIIWLRHRENLRELPDKLIAAGRKRGGEAGPAIDADPPDSR